MAILTVGPGEMYQTISAAVNVAQDGDVLRVDGGTYTDDYPPVLRVSLRFEAVGSRVVCKSTQNSPNGKGIFIAGGQNTNPSISFDGFDFIGAKCADMNGAGIRYQAGDLKVTNCYFRNCQNGILATPFVKGTGTVVIDRTEIDACGAGDGQSHNLYIGYINSFVMTNSLSRSCKVGHLVKTRARSSTITGSRLLDDQGNPSYSVDCPNAGDLVISNCQIQQSAKNSNLYLVTWGVGGASNPGRTAHITSCVIVNDATSVKLVYNSVAGVPVCLETCQMWGVPNSVTAVGRGLVQFSGTVWLSGRPTLDTTPPYNTVFSGEDPLEVHEGEDDPLPAPDFPDPKPDDGEEPLSGGK